MVIMIEPAPYMTRLVMELDHAWPGPVVTYFLARSVTQPWSDIALADSYTFLPKGFGATLQKLWSHLRRARPKIVFVAGWGEPRIIAAILMARLNGARVVASSDTWVSNSTGLRVALKTMVLRLIDRFTPGGSRQEAYLHGLGIDPGHVFRASMTVDTTALRQFIATEGAARRHSVRAALGIGDEEVLFLFLGRLEPEKGPDLAIRSFLLAGLGGQAHLLVVGDGSLRAELEEKAGGSERISFAGRLEGHALWSRLVAADVLLAPSRSEPWGLVVNEALVAGLPVIVSDCFGCIDDLVHRGRNGIVVATGDVDGTAAAIRSLVRDADLRHAQATAAGEIISGWTSENWARNIIAAWKDALR